MFIHHSMSLALALIYHHAAWLHDHSWISVGWLFFEQDLLPSSVSTAYAWQMLTPHGPIDLISLEQQDIVLISSMPFNKLIVCNTQDNCLLTSRCWNKVEWAPSAYRTAVSNLVRLQQLNRICSQILTALFSAFDWTLVAYWSHNQVQFSKYWTDTLSDFSMRYSKGVLLAYSADKMSKYSANLIKLHARCETASEQ